MGALADSPTALKTVSYHLGHPSEGLFDSVWYRGTRNIFWPDGGALFSYHTESVVAIQQVPAGYTLATSTATFGFQSP